MADPNLAAIILVGNTSGHVLGVTEGFSFEETHEVAKIQGEGDLGPTAVGIWRSDLTALVDFVVKGVIAKGTIASLVFTSKDSAGNTITDTLLTMMALGYAKDFQKKSPPGRYRQLFQHKGAMASDPVS